MNKNNIVSEKLSIHEYEIFKEKVKFYTSINRYYINEEQDHEMSFLDLINAQDDARFLVAINAQDSEGYTMLHKVCYDYGNDVNFVEILLKLGASLSILNENNSNCFHIAAARGNDKILQCLLKQPNIHQLLSHQNTFADTPLHCAVEYGSSHVVKLLVDANRESLFLNDEIDRTPLDIAIFCYRERKKIVEIIKESLNTENITR
jgi:ankyrin repeat protein